MHTAEPQQLEPVEQEVDPLHPREAATASLFQTWFDGKTWGPFRPIFFTVKTDWWEGYDEHLDSLLDLENIDFGCAPGWTGILTALQTAFETRKLPVPPISRSAFLALGRDFERRSDLMQWHLTSPEDFCSFFCSALYRLSAGEIPPIAIASRVYIPGDTHDDATLWHLTYSQFVPYLKEQLALDWSEQFEFPPLTWNEDEVASFLGKVFAHVGLTPPRIPICVLYQLFREVDVDGCHKLTEEDSQILAETILLRVTQLQSVIERMPSPSPRTSRSSRPSQWFPAPDSESRSSASRDTVSDVDDKNKPECKEDAGTPLSRTKTDDDVCTVLGNIESVQCKPDESDGEKTHRAVPPPFYAFGDGTATPTVVGHSITTRNTDAIVSELQAALRAKESDALISQRGELERAHERAAALEKELSQAQRVCAEESSELRAISDIVEAKYRAVVDAGAPSAGVDGSLVAFTGVRLDEQLATVLTALETDISQAEETRATMLAQAHLQAEAHTTECVRAAEAAAKAELDAERDSLRQEMEEEKAKQAREWDATRDTWRSEHSELEADLQIARKKSKDEAEAADASWAKKEEDMERTIDLLQAEVRVHKEEMDRSKGELERMVTEASDLRRASVLMQQELPETKHKLTSVTHELALLKIEHQRLKRENHDASENKDELRNQEAELRLAQKNLRRETREMALEKEELKRAEEASTKKLAVQQEEIATIKQRMQKYQDESVVVETQVRAAEARLSAIQKEADLEEARLRSFQYELEEERNKNDKMRNSELNDTTDDLRAVQLDLTTTVAELRKSENALTRSKSQLLETDRKLHEMTSEVTSRQNALERINVDIRRQRELLAIREENLRECGARDSYEGAGTDSARERHMARRSLAAARDEMHASQTDKEKARQELLSAREATARAHEELRMANDELAAATESRQNARGNGGREAELERALASEKKMRVELERRFAAAESRINDGMKPSRHIDAERLQSCEASEARLAAELEEMKELTDLHVSKMEQTVESEARQRAEALRWRERAQELGQALERAKREFFLNSGATSDDSVRKTASLEEELRIADEKVQKTSTALRIAASDTEYVVQELNKVKQQLAEEKSLRWHCQSELNEAQAHNERVFAQMNDLEGTKSRLRDARVAFSSPNAKQKVASVTPRSGIRRAQSEKHLRASPQGATVADRSRIKQRETSPSPYGSKIKLRETSPYGPTVRLKETSPYGSRIKPREASPYGSRIKPREASPQRLQAKPRMPTSPMNNKAMFARLATLEDWISGMKNNAKTGRTESIASKRSVSPSVSRIRRRT